MLSTTQKFTSVTEDYRLGLRLAEFAALTGMSMPTLWRRVKSGDVRIVRIGDMPIIPRAELIRLGLIAA